MNNKTRATRILLPDPVLDGFIMSIILPIMDC